MIVYAATKGEFSDDVRSNTIEDIILDAFKQKLGRIVGRQEVAAWKSSLQYINNVLFMSRIPDNAGVAVEFRIPQTSKRIDVLLTGRSSNGRKVAVIIELKQWQNAGLTGKDAIVSTFLAGRIREVEHPSYQAWTYAALMHDYNETVRKSFVLYPCAYLHNCESVDVINNSFYQNHINRAPAFLKKDAKKLAEFISTHVSHGDDKEFIYQIDKGRISPSKSLADKLNSMLQGNQEFLMIDDQKLVFEEALHLSRKASPKSKQVLIVEGGPGTGKSVVAVNLLVELTNQGRVVQYVTKNAAPRAVYESKLTGTYKKSEISNLFRGSGSFTDCKPNTFHTLLVDEAHRLNEKSGLYQNQGENQIKELINSSCLTVFFIDEDQRVTFKDVGSVAEIERWANQLGAEVSHATLSSQFRCNGSDGYLQWLDLALQLRDVPLDAGDTVDYDFQVFQSPQDLRNRILKLSRDYTARMVAGYCWEWKTKKEPAAYDVEVPNTGFKMRWNLQSDGSLWIVKDSAINEIGCIHTCQGLELQYIGVIIGPDLIVRDGKVITRPERRARMDQSLKGYKRLMQANPGLAKLRADALIKNTYKTLMSRGLKGCYIFCTDPETNDYFNAQAKSFIACLPVIQAKPPYATSPETAPAYPGLSLKVLELQDVQPYINSIPLVSLKIAAGGFSRSQAIEEFDWIEVPTFIRPSDDLFVAQVLGESMNRHIPNGSWCLFKANVTGSRQGKIVLVQHHDIWDEDLGGQYTIKRYSSSKSYRPDGTWEHTRIVLMPDSTIDRYQPIVLTTEDEGSVSIIAEILAVL